MRAQLVAEMPRNFVSSFSGERAPSRAARAAAAAAERQATGPRVSDQRSHEAHKTPGLPNAPPRRSRRSHAGRATRSACLPGASHPHHSPQRARQGGKHRTETFRPCRSDLSPEAPRAGARRPPRGALARPPRQHSCVASLADVPQPPSWAAIRAGHGARRQGASPARGSPARPGLHQAAPAPRKGRDVFASALSRAGRRRRGEAVEALARRESRQRAQRRAAAGQGPQPAAPRPAPPRLASRRLAGGDTTHSLLNSGSVGAVPPPPP